MNYTEALSTLSSNLLRHVEECFENKGNHVSTWAVLYSSDGKTFSAAAWSDVCHARCSLTAYKGEKEVIYLTGALNRRVNDKVRKASELFYAFLESDKSPWKALKPQWDKERNFFAVHHDEIRDNSFALLINFSIACRLPHEHQSRLLWWEDMVTNHGFTGTEALWIISFLRREGSKIFQYADGHYPFNCDPLPSLLKLKTGGYASKSRNGFLTNDYSPNNSPWSSGKSCQVWMRSTHALEEDKNKYKGSFRGLFEAVKDENFGKEYVTFKESEKFYKTLKERIADVDF